MTQFFKIRHQAWYINTLGSGHVQRQKGQIMIKPCSELVASLNRPTQAAGIRRYDVPSVLGTVNRAYTQFRNGARKRSITHWRGRQIRKIYRTVRVRALYYRPIQISQSHGLGRNTLQDRATGEPVQGVIRDSEA